MDWKTQHTGLGLRPQTWVLTELRALGTEESVYKIVEKDLCLLHWPKCSLRSLLLSHLLAVHALVMDQLDFSLVSICLPSSMAESGALGRAGAPWLKYTNSKEPRDSSGCCPRARQTYSWGGSKWNHTSIVKAMWTKRPINNALCGSSGLWGSRGRLSPGFFGVTIKSQAAEAEATSHQNRTC